MPSPQQTLEQERTLMTRKKNNRKAERTALTPQLRSKVLVQNDMIGGGKIELLRLIADTGSISAAAKSMGLGYRRAWFLIETIQRIFDQPVLISERGGTGGGTQLTPFGAELVQRHAAFDQQITDAAADFLDWLGEHQSKARQSDASAETP